MNLYEFSEKNNREMSIVLTRRDDGDCFADALAEAHSIITAALGGTPHTAPLAVPLAASPLATQVPPSPEVKREIDQALIVQCIVKMLQQLPDNGTQFSLETKPLSEIDEITRAAYFLKAIKCVAGVLKGFPIPVRPGLTCY